jgi:hypothetical protein
MVETKGGLNALSLDGLVRRITCWYYTRMNFINSFYLLIDSLSYHRAELYGANLNQSQPRLLPMQNSLTTLPQISARRRSSVITSRCINLLSGYAISPGLIRILQDMSNLTSFLDSFRYGSIMSEESFLNFDNERISIESRLLCLPGKAQVSHHRDAEAYHIQESCRIAAIMYMKVAFYQVEPTAPLQISLVSRLKIDLMQTKLTDLLARAVRTALVCLICRHNRIPARDPKIVAFESSEDGVFTPKSPVMVQCSRDCIEVSVVRPDLAGPL